MMIRIFKSEKSKTKRKYIKMIKPTTTTVIRRKKQLISESKDDNDTVKKRIIS